MNNPCSARRLRTCAVTLFLASGLAAPATADVVISTSNDPSVQLARNLDGLLGPRAGEPRAGEIRARRGTPLTSLFARPAGEAGGPAGGPAQALPATNASYSREALAALPEARGGADWSCLTQALYFEARGELVRGIFAVAEVILNRADSARFPTTVCGVIRQGTGRKYQCQFSYFCDGKSEEVHERAAWARVGKVARLMLDGAPRPLTGGATYYHTRAVNPRWARVFDRTAAIGAHLFYRNG